MCVLEDVSFTRKDGQYLRWDRRAARKRLSDRFVKTKIRDFREAVVEQLEGMALNIEGYCPDGQSLLELRHGLDDASPPQVIEGTCLEILPSFPQNEFDVIFTSPPYCNRYDYTRTYALELAYWGASKAEVSHLRQQLLSCTVENREKQQQLRVLYKTLNRSELSRKAEAACLAQRALQEVLDLLDRKRIAGELNNANLVRMIRNYFVEMSYVVFEMARVLKPGGYVVMVNDNVQYAGEEIPVDLILSEFAVAAGLSVKSIWVLGSGKGNSSQQMGTHGRTELRKCVYLWLKVA